MKYLASLLSSILVVNVLSCRKVVEVPRQERSELASRIAVILPPTWAIQERSSEFIINRQNPVRLFNCINLDASLIRDEERFKQFIDRNGVTANYQIRLRRAAKLESSEYARLKALNDQIVVTRDTLISSRDFYADDAMRSSDSRYHELPLYYDETSSIYVETNVHPYECMYPHAVAEECDSVRLALDSLFTRYSTDTHRTLGYGLW